MKKASIRISLLALIVFLVPLANRHIGLAVAQSRDIDEVILAEAFLKPEKKIYIGDRIEIKLILKNESDRNMEIAGMLSIDGKGVLQKEIIIKKGEEGDLLYYYALEDIGRHDISVHIKDNGEKDRGGWGSAREIWSGEITAEKREIVGVDLRIVGGISVYPPLPKPDEEVELTVIIKNVGNENAKDVVVIFYVDGSSLEREIVDIDAGESVIIMVVWEAVDGEKLIRAVVDPKGVFGDYHFNNVREKWVTVR
ncbi:MAG: hypothetical protein JW984_02495 [Deltaproteobacteria bacterium]|uniref:CARDB domain-containing protein n=1 Tax=Candidatus Zymogenus saltonus TaxID=2844893 RepID=A0A9D8PNL4_9DELT|nr:hypothetical protein [Candidatus Zymogenus saltonus]